MENLSRPVPKKAYSGNGFGAKTVYDDVFGGSPKFGVPTLSPRIEDYAEIFGSHASRGSSIPILDLPAVDEADFCFNARSSHFDYSEVFGGFSGLDFAVSVDELFNQEKTRYDSSDEAWTPAQSESLSDDSESYACSESNQILSNGESFQSCDGITKFNISYNKANQRSEEDMPNGMGHITQLHAVPGYSFIIDETLPAQKIKDMSQVTGDFNLNADFSGGQREGKQLRKTKSQPSHSRFGIQTLGADLKPVRNGKTPFVTVSDISLRTQPSQLPPPSRPPPPLAEQDGNSDRQKSKLKASASFAFGETVGDSSPPFYDVEMDASSSAAVSAAAVKDAMEIAQAKLKSAKEVIRIKERLQSCSKLELKNDTKSKEGKARKAVNGSNCLKDENLNGTFHRDCSEMKILAGVERQKTMKTARVVSDSTEGINVAKVYANKKRGKEFRSSQESYHTEGTAAWQEAEQFYEVIETDTSRKIVEQGKVETIMLQNAKVRECGQGEKATPLLQRQDEESGKTKTDREGREWDENKRKSKATAESSRQEEYEKKVKMNQEQCKQEEHGEPRMAKQHGDIEKIHTKADKREKCENLAENQQKPNEVESEKIMKGKIVDDKDAHEREGNQMRLKETFDSERYNKRLQEAIEQPDIEKRIKEAFGHEENEKEQREACERREKEKKQEEAHQREENERRLKDALVEEENKNRLKQSLDQREACERRKKEKKQEEAQRREENERRLKDALVEDENKNRLTQSLDQREAEKRLNMAIEQGENEKKHKLAFEKGGNETRVVKDLRREQIEKTLRAAIHQEGNGKIQIGAHKSSENQKRVNEACEREGNDERLVEAREIVKHKKLQQEACEREESEKRTKVALKQREAEKKSEEANEDAETWRIENADLWEGLKAHSKDHQQAVSDENRRKFDSTQRTCERTGGNNLKEFIGTCQVNDSENIQRSRAVHKQDENIADVKTTKQTFSFEEDRTMRVKPMDSEEQVEAVEVVNQLFEEQLDSSGMTEDDLQHEKNQIRVKDAKESLHLHDTLTESVEAGTGIVQTQVDRNREASNVSSNSEKPNVLKKEVGKRWGTNVREVPVAFNKEESENKFMPSQVDREVIENGKSMGIDRPTVLDGKRNIESTIQKVRAIQKIETKEKGLNDILTPEEREKEEKLKREKELEQDRLRKIEEEREREREREKDRMAIDRATLEARERASSEARERAERTAVERATAEVRQRVLAEARERLEKASTEARERLSAEKASMEARLRAERAAVERATAEARERAFQKAMAEKAAIGARERVEKSSFKSGGMRQSSPFSDVQDVQCQNVGSSSGSIYSYSSVHGDIDFSAMTQRFAGVEGESPQRCKARLERHRRTAERAAKALAEKNMRDLLAQREQAERNRLAEALDAEVKRWSSGKEGNLRALISTLQYILGPDSGWQPIPLTEVITSVAVKKAYRKATLCVHPDKLQQRGASIQQKYICEKVFDLLKEAWNRFNSEER